MISYVDEIEAIFDIYEAEHLTEAEISQRSIELVKKHDFDRDFMFDINDTLYNRGYSFQFEVPQLERELFDSEKYEELCSNVGKSKDKTEELIEYLKNINDFRLGLASIHMLKVKYLIALGYLSEDNEFIKANSNLDLRTLLFKSYEYDLEAKTIIVESLEDFGIPYSTLEYMEFRLDVEYLLWTIERDDPNRGYLKVNTFKVALNLAPKEYFVRNGKCYYNEKFSKVTKDYLKLISQKCVNIIKDWWDEEGYTVDGTGYRLLYQLLTQKQ